MKRISIRLGILATVLMLGVVAIAQTIRSSGTRSGDRGPQVAANQPVPARLPQPIPVGANEPAPRLTVPTPLPTAAPSTRPDPAAFPSLPRPNAFAPTAEIPAPRSLPALDTPAPGMADPYGLRNAARNAVTEHDGAPATSAASELPSLPLPTNRTPDPTAAAAENPYRQPTFSAQPSRPSALPSTSFAPSGLPVTPPSTAPALTDLPRIGAEPSANRVQIRTPNFPPNETVPSEAAVAASEPVRLPRGAMQPSQPEPVVSRQPAAGSEHLEGNGVPGNKQFEGVQTPSLAVEKKAPTEIQVDKPATFEVHVRNVGQIAAHQVTVTDQIPKGTRLIEASPQPTVGRDGTIAFHLNALAPGESAIATMTVMPFAEGEIGSVARVSFEAQASARTICTRPELHVEVTAPPKVLIGEKVVLSITISNPGTGAASGVIIEEDVPEGLAHSAGKELEYELGVLRAGETKRLQLTLTADKAGIVNNVLVVRGDGNLMSQSGSRIEVLSPQLQVTLGGPKVRYLEREATYAVTVANPGSAPARDVELIAYLPKGLKFVSTENKGQYDAQNHAVYWSLEELPPATTGNVALVTLPVEVGEQKLRLEGKANLGLADQHEMNVIVDGLSELSFSVADKEDPVEVGGENTYEIRVSNSGSKMDTNIRVIAELPTGLQPLSGDGPTSASVQGQRVIFEPLAKIDPKKSEVFKIRVRHQRSGVQLLRVQLASDELTTPVTKEESTRVYTDK